MAILLIIFAAVVIGSALTHTLENKTIFNVNNKPIEVAAQIAHQKKNAALWSIFEINVSINPDQFPYIRNIMLNE